MAGTKISVMPDGQPLVATDNFVISRPGVNARMSATQVASFVASTLPSSADVHGNAVFPVAGSFNLVVPAGVTQMVYTGAGAGGAGGAHNGVSGGGGGAGGVGVFKKLLTVVPGETLTIVNGAGGVSGAGNGTAGNTTSVTGSVSGSLVSLPGGLGGRSAANGGAGGGPSAAGQQVGTSGAGIMPGEGGNTMIGLGGRVVIISPFGSSGPSNGGGGYGGAPTLQGPSGGASGCSFLEW